MFNATLVNRIDITPELVILHVKPDEVFKDFHPGQYVALGLPGTHPRPAHFPVEKEEIATDKLIKRAYSIGSSPHQREHLEFYIAIVPDGGLTSRLALLKPGDRLFAAPKIIGTFTLQGIPSDANLVMVATGTGIAPFIAMIRTPTTWTTGRSVTLLHGVRYATDLAYREELESLCKERSDLAYHAVVSRGEEAWHGHRGHVQRLFQDGVVPLNPERDHVLLCGNPAMIDEMEKYLVARGYKEHTRKSPGNLHLERYW